VDLRITDAEIRTLLANVTEQQRAHCAKNMGGADFPERLIRQSRKSPDLAFNPTPLSVDTLWALIINYANTPLPPRVH
jgi:hypothetical protein